MTAFLLIWSPKKWPWPELPDLAKRVAAGVAVTDVWGCGFARSILPGDRVFLHRVAQQPKGIFGSGYVTRARTRSPTRRRNAATACASTSSTTGWSTRMRRR